MFDQVKKLMEMKKQADLLKKELEATIIDVSETRGIKVVLFMMLLFIPFLLKFRSLNNLKQLEENYQH